MASFHHAGGNAPSGKNGHQTAAQVFRALDQHGAADSLAGIVDKIDRAVSEKRAKIVDERYIDAPVGGVRIVSQKLCIIIDGAGDAEHHAVKALRSDPLFTEVILHIVPERLKGVFQGGVLSMRILFHGIHVADQSAKRQCDGFWPQVDAQQFSVVGKYKQLRLLAAQAGGIAQPQRLDDTAVTVVLQRAHDRDTADTRTFVDITRRHRFTGAEHLHYSLAIDALDIRGDGHGSRRGR